MHPKNQLETLIELGFKQEVIAKSIDVAQSTISRILSGDIENPTWQVSTRINEMFLRESENAKTPVA